MKHLKKFENKSNFEEELQEIKLILTELKDEYTYIEGQIFIPEKEKPHLEHPIPINKIISEYIDGELTALEAICMPICNIQDADKHHLQGDWELNATWSRPFKRYQLAGIKKEIIGTC